MKTTLTIAFYFAFIVLACASPRLNRRQAPPAPAPVAPALAPASDPVAHPAAPEAPAAAPGAPAASAPTQPEARAAPQRRPPPPPQPSGPSVFVLPDGAGLILGQVKEGFTCEGKIYGYYADTNNDCKIFHVCVPVLDNQGQATQPPLIFSFFCNNGTIFNQENLVCDYADNVDCAASESHYSINQEFGKIPEGSAQGRSAPSPAQPAPAHAQPAPAPAQPAPAPAQPAPAPAQPAPAPAQPAPAPAQPAPVPAVPAPAPVQPAPTPAQPASATGTTTTAQQVASAA